MSDPFSAETIRAAQPKSPFEALAADDPPVIGGYPLQARLGSGGMGRVYLAFTPGGRPLAVKVVRREFAEDPEFRQRFAQEIRAAQRVNGVYTAQVVDAGPDAEQPWLATAYVPGPSLAAAVREFGPLPVRTVLPLVAAVAESLAAIHAASVIHRDLKPANVVLAADGPRVIDFGIARAADSTPLTATGMRIGTPQYMAPEQALGQSAVPATDLFSLGSLAFFAATGRTPFGDGQEMAVLYRVVNEQPDLSACPPELLPLVQACLIKDPAERIGGPALIDLCRQLAGGDLRITPEWLPQAVATEATRRAVVAPVVAPVAGAAGAGVAGAAGAGVVPVAAAGQVPAQVLGEWAEPTTGLVPGQGQGQEQPIVGGAVGVAPSLQTTHFDAAAPLAVQPGVMPYAPGPGGADNLGGPVAPGVAPGKPAKSPRWGVRLLVGALAVVLIAGAGAVAAISLTSKNSNDSADTPPLNSQSTGPSTAPAVTLPSAQATTVSPANDVSTIAPTTADPTDGTLVGNGSPPGTLLGSDHIDLPEGYGFNLTSDLSDPNTAVVNESGVNLDVDFPGDAGYFEASTPNATLAILQPGTAGGYQACLDDTQYASQMNLTDLSVGTEICDITPKGRVALLKITHLPAQGDASTYIGFDITLWQGVISDD